MGVYDRMVRNIGMIFEHNVKFNYSNSESFVDITYQGHIVLRVTDCDSFCVLESPILLTDEPHGHTIILFECDDRVIENVVIALDTAIHRLSVLFRVLKDRFEYYKVDKSFYFKVENVFLKVTLDFDGWICESFVGPDSTYSYLRVVSKLSKELCDCTGNKLSLNVSIPNFSKIQSGFFSGA